MIDLYYATNFRLKRSNIINSIYVKKFSVMINFSSIFLINTFLVFTLWASLSTVIDFFSIYRAYSIDVPNDSIKEIRENILEVRLSLQKGDLIEALQHLNNVDEELLLLTSSNSSLLEFESNKK